MTAGKTFLLCQLHTFLIQLFKLPDLNLKTGSGKSVQHRFGFDHAKNDRPVNGTQIYIQYHFMRKAFS